ncbi:histidine phosphatase family protein [Streptomyces sp. NPDC088246]|uniref:histidine phosphatase family protein n=1 Tax=Streptomyces sp. NPDC088246 TaxID=3365842 RepID=UPI00382D8907
MDALYASTHQRTELSAAPLAAPRGLQVLIRDGIREVSAGHWEGASDHASHSAFLEFVFGWPTDPTTRVPGGESGLGVLEQLDGVVDEAVQSGVGTVAMVSHGVAIRVWLAARAVNFSVRDVMQCELDNTGVVIADRSVEGTWQVCPGPDYRSGRPAMSRGIAARQANRYSTANFKRTAPKPPAPPRPRVTHAR